jgi:hypothetical protein
VQTGKAKDLSAPLHVSRSISSTYQENRFTYFRINFTPGDLAMLLLGMLGDATVQSSHGKFE